MASDDQDRAAFPDIDIWEEFFDEELRFVKHNDPDTKTLILNCYDDFTEEAWAKVGSYLKNNTHVQRLSISQSELDYNKFEALMNGGLKDNTSLTGLGLSGNEHMFDEDSLNLLATFLEKNKQIEDLNLGETDVTPNELKLLIPALDGSKVKYLDFSHGMLQDDMQQYPDTLGSEGPVVNAAA